MIDKKLSDVQLKDIQHLVQMGVTENKRLEFKRFLDIDKYEGKHKKKLVREVSGFANEAGGDLIVGVDENDSGEAKAICGVELDSADELKQQWGQILRNNIDPSIPSSLLDIKPIECSNHGDDRQFIILIRTFGSWKAPHRETITNQFYGRSPSGKHPLDMDEIRNRFLEKERFRTQIKAFRDERIDSILDDSGIPINIVRGPLFVLHIIPSNAFVQGTVIDPRDAEQARNNYLKLLGRGRGNASRYNTDGYFFFSRTTEERPQSHGAAPKEIQAARKYVQIFRSGPIESVTDKSFVHHSNTQIDVSYISADVLRPKLKDHIEGCLELLNDQEARYPYVVFLTAIHANGHLISHDKHEIYKESRKFIDRNDARLPEVLVDSPSVTAENVVSDLMDYLYQAAGHQGEPLSQKDKTE